MRRDVFLAVGYPAYAERRCKENASPLSDDLFDDMSQETLIKIIVPEVFGVYQGTERWKSVVLTLANGGLSGMGYEWTYRQN